MLRRPLETTPVIDTYLGASVRCTKATESSSIIEGMSAEGGRPMRKLYWCVTLVVLAHAVVVFWHLELLARRDAALKVDQVPLFAGLANMIPLIALISLWAHFPKLGAWLLLFLAVPLAIGGYSPFSESWFGQCFQNVIWRIDICISDQRGAAIRA